MSQQKCPNCQTEIPADAPGGVCPKCVFAAAADKKPPSPYVTTMGGTPTQHGSFVAPTPEELTQHFDDLKVEKLIGYGGMGAVYRARQLRLDRVVALKILSPALGHDPTFTERFAREARTLARLTHPNIVMVFEFGVIDEMCFLVMEFIDGVNLRDAIRNKTITAEEALQIVPQICEALQFAHDEGVVHRDIKPENILLNQRGQIKIADFGLAKILDRDPVEFSLTGTHQILGTRNYMAPEQIEKPDTVDHRADIYSLGVVFYELLTGELPIGRFANPSEKAAINSSLDDVVLRTLEKEPDRRYQQASEFKTAVESVERKPPKQHFAEQQHQMAANEALRPPVGAAAPNKPSHDQQAPQSPAGSPAGFANMRSPIPTAKAHVPFSIGDLHGGFAAAYGIAKVDSGKLNLEYEVRDEVFGSVKSGPKLNSIDVSEILSVDYNQGMFSGTLRVVTDSVAIANPVPNSKQGTFTIKIAKKDFALGRSFFEVLNDAVQSCQGSDVAAKTPGQKPIQNKNLTPNQPGHMKRAADAANYVATGNLADQGQLDQSDESSNDELQEKLAAPANGLMVVAIINLIINGGRVVRFIADMIRNPVDTVQSTFDPSNWNPGIDFGNDLGDFIRQIVRLVVNPFDGREWLLAIGVSILLLFASAQMKKFRNYTWCVGISIVALLPLYDIYILGLIFAIYSLVVLFDPDIKERFQQAAVSKSPYVQANRGGMGLSRFIQFFVSIFFILIAVTVVAGVAYVVMSKESGKGDDNVEIIDQADQDSSVQADVKASDDSATATKAKANAKNDKDKDADQD